MRSTRSTRLVGDPPDQLSSLVSAHMQDIVEEALKHPSDRGTSNVGRGGKISEDHEMKSTKK